MQILRISETFRVITSEVVFQLEAVDQKLNLLDKLERIAKVEGSLCESERAGHGSTLLSFWVPRAS